MQEQDSAYEVNWRKIDIKGHLPFIGVHLACALVFWAGFSWTALLICFASYCLRMFTITAGFHRYFSHRAYRTSRLFQFILAFIGTSSAQKGPLWWAANHRHHHRYSDQFPDYHSPGLKGFLWAHFGWIMTPEQQKTNYSRISDFAKYPELRVLNDHFYIPPIIYAVAMFYFGVLLNFLFPGLGTSGFQMLVWGFFISTTLLYHGTFCVNSICHIFGKQRFESKDDSKNNWLVAIITLGEGWHNNHHRYSSSVNQGLYWWEYDVSHYVLVVLSWFGIVWGLRTTPDYIYEEAKSGKSAVTEETPKTAIAEATTS